MHNISELERMTLQELEEIARGLGLEPNPLMEPKELIYAIIDEESIVSSQRAVPEKKKRVRKPKNATVAADESEATSATTDAAAAEKPKRTRKTKASQDASAAEEQPQKTVAAKEPQEVKEPKRRGRKSKAEKEAESSAKREETIAAEANVVADGQREAAEERLQEPAPAAEDASEEEDFIIIKDIPDLSLSGGYHSVPQPESAKEIEAPSAQHKADAPQAAKGAAPAAILPEFDFDNAIIGSGVLEVMNEGYGYLRSSDYNYMPAPDDIYITPQQIRQWGLKMGDVVEGPIKLPRDNEKFFTMPHIDRINGRKPHEIRDRVAFEHLTPLFPNEKFTLCGEEKSHLSVRVVDLFSPIGKGQRALIVAQPKTGKTMLLKEIANAIAAHHPDAYLMVLLIDERPEEVTDMARTVNAEVIASTFDEPADHHVHVANLVIEKAKRMVESGHDVVIFLDSITRLARAYNTVAPASGKILSGGVDANSLQKPKRFFGAARNIEGGGSLTIIATALIDTGSKMDEVIFEEFKGTGNMELQLDRQLANKRIFPAVNIIASSTRRDELLQSEDTRNRMWIIRNMISEMTTTEAMTFMKDRLEMTKNNEEMLTTMGKTAQ
ncbi:MAG: transcription termination factor Rho [Bacteroidaceae bacterium]|nr:transcription termination factor Rho [Bacteroidaceae bacterium]